MARINTGRVALGGLAAGFVINVFDFVSNNFILASDWQRVAQARNISYDAMGGLSGLLTYVVVDLLLGMLVVWTYASIRPRYGPGAGTAVMAAFAVFLASTLVTGTMAGVFFPWDVYIRAASLALVAILAGGLAGTRLYREDHGTSEDSL